MYAPAVEVFAELIVMIGCHHLLCRETWCRKIKMAESCCLRFSFFFFLAVTHLLIHNIPPRRKPGPVAPHTSSEVCTCTLLTKVSFIHASPCPPLTIKNFNTKVYRLSGHLLKLLPFWHRGRYSWSEDSYYSIIQKRQSLRSIHLTLRHNVHKCIL